jgi:hypothetical protein
MPQAISLPCPDGRVTVVVDEGEFWNQVEQWGSFLRQLPTVEFSRKTASYAYEPSVIARVTHVIAATLRPKDVAGWGALIQILPGLLYLQVTPEEGDVACVTAQEILQEAFWLLLFEKLQAIWSTLNQS